MNTSLDDIKEASKLKFTEMELITLLEIDIEDLVERFTDIIEEKQKEIIQELGLEVEDSFIDSYYEDRE